MTEARDVHISRQVQELLDKQQIHEVLMRYCRGVDRSDADLIDSAFHPDALITTNRGSTEYSGADAGRTIVGLLRKEDRCMHYGTNEFVKIDGDVADCESYWLALRVRFDGEGSALFHNWGRYVDRFERRHGQWRIARRVNLNEWSMTERTTQSREVEGKFDPWRSREDLSYERVS
jgi:hypothetical protein